MTTEEAYELGFKETYGPIENRSCSILKDLDKTGQVMLAYIKGRMQGILTWADKEKHGRIKND